MNYEVTLHRFVEGSAQEQFDAAFRAMIPGLEAIYEDYVRRVFRAYVDKYGPDLKGIRNEKTVSVLKTLRGLLSPNMRQVGSGALDLRYELDDSALTTNKRQYARDTAQAWREKIRYKVGYLDDVHVHSLDSTSFEVTGLAKGEPVRINQRMIFNISSHGTIFNQYPALIWYAGKKMSEEEFIKFMDRIGHERPKSPKNPNARPKKVYKSVPFPNGQTFQATVPSFVVLHGEVGSFQGKLRWMANEYPTEEKAQAAVKRFRKAEQEWIDMIHAHAKAVPSPEDYLREKASLISDCELARDSSHIVRVE